MADNTNAVGEPTQPLIDGQPDPKTLAVGAAESATPATQPTGLESGMAVITTPQGKASVDKNAPAFVTDAFDQAAAPPLGTVPVMDDSGKRIIGSAVLRGNPARGKGKLVVNRNMVTLTNGQNYVAGQYVDPKDLSDDEKDLFTNGDSPALVPFESLGK